MKISDHFTLREMEKSQTALRMGIDNKITNPEHLLNISALAQNILEPLREKWGPVSISSGYRHPNLCEALGSKKTSSHAVAEAVDCEMFKSPGNRAVFEWIVKESGLSWDQLILEFEDTSGKDVFQGWLHISSKRCKSENRMQILRAVKNDGKTAYEHGVN